MSSNFSIETLKKIRSQKKSQKLYSTLGLIVDCTNPHRKDVKKDYCMRLKIIDPSLNGDQSLTVFLYAKNIDDFPKNLAIGDILFVKQYIFEVDGDKFSCKKPFKSLESEFRFFSGKPQQTAYYPIDDNIGINDENGQILHCIVTLRKFSKNYFKATNVPLFSKGGQSSDFDLILKVNDCQQQQGTNNTWRITLGDATKHVFKLLHFRPIKNGVYKVRSIANLSWNQNQCHLIGNDFTNFLEIADWMKSYSNKQWQKLSVEKSKITTESDKLSTKLLHEKRTQMKQVISLRDLIRKESHTQEIKVRCEFVEVFTSFDNALKKFDQENLIEQDFQRQNGKYIYNVHFAITDQSLKNEVYNVYLYTYDNKGSQFLPGLNVDGIYGKNVLDYTQKYEHIVNRLLQETDYETAPLEIILSPMNNGRQTVYRIVNTQLIL